MTQERIDYPLFSKINLDTAVATVAEYIEQSKDLTIQQLAAKKFTWNDFVEGTTEIDRQISEIVSPIMHLHAVQDSDKLREVVEQLIPILTEYSIWVGQNEEIYQACQTIYNSEEFKTYSPAQKSSLELSLKNFKLSGVNLEAEKKAEFAKIENRLSELSFKFSNNLLDATMAWTKVITDVNELKGVPASTLEIMQQNALAKGAEGYLVTLDQPIYVAILTYCENRELRKEVATAYKTRASDQGPNKGEFDNSAIIEEILKLREESAHLLGYKNYAEVSLANKMAETPTQVEEFLQNLASKAKDKAKLEKAETEKFTAEKFGVTDLWSSDYGYYSEKLRQELYSIDDEALRVYFPEDRVLTGLFAVVNNLYGITIKEHLNADKYHEDVKLFDVFNQDGSLQGAFYIDLYARQNKRGGAWMDGAVNRALIRSTDTLLHPVAYLTCNFNRPLKDGEPALFTHDEVVTLFHEFGHTMHHLLTKVDVGSVSGTNVAWDAVELPSQIMENWCWETESLNLFAKHYKTGENIPADIVEKLIAAKNYHSALFIVRQLEFAIFDFSIHNRDQAPSINEVMEILHSIQKEISPYEVSPIARFPHSFGHIFGGGYAAGYYSYLWAEVLSADAFSRFKKEGVFNRATGLAFLDSILSKGGSRPMMELFTNFMGRKPEVEALLKSYNIV